jgi:hypothetical protein
MAELYHPINHHRPHVDDDRHVAMQDGSVRAASPGQPPVGALGATRHAYDDDDPLALLDLVDDT